VNAGDVTLVAVTGATARGHRGDQFQPGQDGP
jgi:hypothetical protein